MAITADRSTEYREGKEYSFPIAAATHLYAGQLIVLDTLGNAEAMTAAASKVAVGCCVEEVNNTGAAAAKSVTVRAGPHKWVAKGGDAPTKATIGDVVYGHDDITVKATAGGHSSAGVMVDLDADGGIWVDTNVSKILASTGLLAANNLSDIGTAATARTNLGLGAADTPTFADVTTTDDVLVGDDLVVSGKATIAETLYVTGWMAGPHPYFVESAHHTVVFATDADAIMQVDTDGVVITLPNITGASEGFQVTIQNIGAAGVTGVSISPDASDMIKGTVGAVTSGGVANKDWVNTKGTSVVGDYTTLVSDGTDTWWIIGGQGVFASEA